MIPALVGGPMKKERKHMNKRKHMDAHLILKTRSSERGMNLIESMIATVVIMVGLTAVLGLFTVGMAHNQAHGDLSSRATTFGQTKMEELLNIPFTNTAMNTTVFPPVTAGGTGLCSLTTANQICGGINPAAPLTGFVDYVDYQGTIVTGSTWFYMRQWMIQADASTNLKTITVLTTARRTPGSVAAPSTVLVAVKSR